MRTRLARATLIVCAFGMLGAYTPETPHLLGPAGRTGSPAPSFAVSLDAGGGAFILRFSTISFVLVFDAERELLSAHMPSDVCGGGQLNRVEVQRVTTPSEIGQVVALTTGEERVAVYHASSPADAGLSAPIDFFGFSNVVDFQLLCSFLGGPNLIAEGTVQRLSTFSAASFHALWTGMISGVDGTDYHLTEVYQLNADVQDPANPDTFRQRVASIQLSPLP